MCAAVDYSPHIRMKDTILTGHYDRRNSWTTSVSSSSSSSTTTTSNSWLERKLFSHFKRLFRRKSLASTSESSSTSSRRTSSAVVAEVLSVSEQPQEEEEEEEEAKAEDDKATIKTESPPSTPPPLIAPPHPVDSLYDYDRLLARCLERQEHDRTALLQRCQTPISIPHADLSVSQSRSTLVNWKSYVRLFRALTRAPHLFRQYIHEHYGCQTEINQREHLTLNIRTSKSSFDNVLRRFLDDYVTCLTCQRAQTHLIKSDGVWRVECQLCGSQRMVKRLRWKQQQ